MTQSSRLGLVAHGFQIHFLFDKNKKEKAAILGLPIFVNTHFAAYDIYSNTLLADIKRWIAAKHDTRFLDRCLDASWKTQVTTCIACTQPVKLRNVLANFNHAIYAAPCTYMNYMRFN